MNKYNYICINITPYTLERYPYLSQLRRNVFLLTAVREKENKRKGERRKMGENKKRQREGEYRISRMFDYPIIIEKRHRPSDLDINVGNIGLLYILRHISFTFLSARPLPNNRE